MIHSSKGILGLVTAFLLAWAVSAHAVGVWWDEVARTFTLEPDCGWYWLNGTEDADAIKGDARMWCRKPDPYFPGEHHLVYLGPESSCDYRLTEAGHYERAC